MADTMKQCQDPPVPAFNPNPQTIAWERLESKRLNKLGLVNISPRSYNVLRHSTHVNDIKGPTMSGADPTRSKTAHVSTKSGVGIPVKSNSMAPWSSLGKATCGYFFTDRTDNKKKNFGIPPSDLVKWRNFSAN